MSEEIGLKAEIDGVPNFLGSVDKMNKAVEDFGNTNQDTAKKTGDLWQDAAGRWRSASGRFASDAELAAAGVEKIAPAAKGAGDAAEKAGKDAEKGGHGFDVFGEIVTGALRKIGEFAISALADASRAVAGFVKDSIGLAGDFEAGMLNFQAVAGKDVDAAGLEKFHDLFLQIGKDLPVSTSDVQNAAIEMIKGGIDPAIVAAGGLRQNIQFAAAAMDGDLVKAAEISGKILGGWADANATAQEKADFLTHSTDLLTKAANASAVDVEGLSLGIFNAQGIAKTAGVSFDDLTTTLAALAPRFASSSEAGNSLKNMIARLQPQTKTAAGYMLDLGLITEDGGNKFYDAEGKFVGFQQASEILKTSLVGLTEQQKTLYLQQIFGNDAMGSAAALADMGADGYQHMADALNTANGVQENAALKQQGFNTALENAKGSVEAFQIQLGEYLLPILTTLFNDYITPGINAVSEFAASFMKMAPAIAASDDPIQSFLNALKIAAPRALGFISAVENIIDVFKDVIGWFSKTGGAADTLGGAVDDLSGIWQKAMGVVDTVMAAYMRIAQAVLPVVAGFIDEHGEEIGTFFQTSWDSIIDIITLALDVYNSIVPPVLNAIAGFIEEHGSEIQKVFGGVWEAVTAIVTGALETIKGVIKLVLDVIHGDWNAAWLDIKNIVDAQATAIGGVVTGLLNAVAGIFDTSLQEILDLWSGNWEQMIDIVSSVDWAQVGSDVIAGIISGIEGASSQLMNTLTNLANDALEAAKDALGIESPSKEFAKVGTFAVEGLMQGFSDTWPALTALVGKISKDLIDEMKDIGTDIQNVIGNSFGATASIDRQLAKNLDSLEDVLPGYLNFTKGALKEAQDQAMAFLDPTEGAKFFKQRSDQIFEFAELQKKLAETTDMEDRARIQQQMNLINAAQTAELKQGEAIRQGSQSASDQIADSINKVMNALAGVKLTDDQIRIVDMLATAWGSLVTPVNTRADAYAHPPTSTTSNTTTLNMPIYTNQSPSVLQSSMAIAGAALL